MNELGLTWVKPKGLAHIQGLTRPAIAPSDLPSIRGKTARGAE
jgi:hypothetical protein